MKNLSTLCGKYSEYGSKYHNRLISSELDVKCKKKSDTDNYLFAS